MNRSRLVAHRGVMQHYPENSWLSIEAAIQAGALWVEFDLQLAADGTFVLLHDADFKRTANRPLSVFEADAAQLSAISVHQPARFGDTFIPTELLTLHQLLSRLEMFPEVRCMVEIKQESLLHWGLERVMDPLLAVLGPVAQRHALISFDYDAIDYAQQMGYTTTGWVLEAFSPAQLRLASRLNPTYLFCNHERIPSPANLPRDSGQWVLYDIMDQQLAELWLTRGASLIESGDIAALLEQPVA